MEIGNKIKQLRVKAKLTQEQLAERLGISAQSISKWETAVTMPDITLLPMLSQEFGVTIDELFDLTAEQKMRRIERRFDTDEEFLPEIFKEYEDFLKNQLAESQDRTRILSLLATLYHHRMQSDAKKVSKYAREAISRNPAEKECQWLLCKSEGQYVWDWNIENHVAIINFYKGLIEEDAETSKKALPYSFLIDNLIADHRTEEAEKYLEIYQTLPEHKPFLIPVYKAHIALAEYDANKADNIICEAAKEFAENGGFLFEAAQYYARKCEYKKAIEYYELSWGKDPEFADALHGIAIIYEILGDNIKAAETYERMIVFLKEKWGYSCDDFVIVDLEKEKVRLLQKD